MGHHGDVSHKKQPQEAAKEAVSSTNWHTLQFVSPDLSASPQTHLYVLKQQKQRHIDHSSLSRQQVMHNQHNNEYRLCCQQVKHSHIHEQSLLPVSPTAARQWIACGGLMACWHST